MTNVLSKSKTFVEHTLFIIVVHTLSFKWLHENVASRIYKCVVHFTGLRSIWTSKHSYSYDWFLILTNIYLLLNSCGIF